MFRRPPHRPHGPAGRRRGAILLVVLTMLALFAVIGLSFVLYAESEANAARLYKEGASANTKPIDPTDAVNGFLGQMIFQQGNTNSALYGHELSRLMYGNAQFAPDRTSAYNGVGIYSEPLAMTLNASPFSLHRTQVVRYGQYFSNPLVNSFVTVLPDQTYADPTWNYSNATDKTKLKYVGRNAPYTYPDRNNISIAVQDPATGRVVKPSYHAPSLFGPLAANNLNWYTPQGYFQLLRPRTINNLTTAEMNYLAGLATPLWPVPTNLNLAQASTLYTILSGNDTAANLATSDSFKRGFPFIAPNPDGSLTGDVQNVKYGEGQQTADSLWIDAGLPRVRHRGRLLQPLIAATVLPLDGRVNYDVAGNLANLTAQSSNHGFGPAEVSLARILLNAAPATVPVDMLKQRYGTGTFAPSPSGSTRTIDYFHGDPVLPTDVNRATYPPSYSRVDYDGNGVNPPTTPTDFRTSYVYPPVTYGNSATTEATQPAVFFNPYQWNPLATTGRAVATTGTQFPIADARYLSARYSEKVKYTQAMTNLGNFDTTNPPVPFGFSANSPLHPMNRARALLTPQSNRLARPGLAPMAIGNIPNDVTNANAPALALNSSAAAAVPPLQTDFAPYLAVTSAPGTPLAGQKFDLTTGQPFAGVVGTTAAVGGDIIGGPNSNAANLRALFQGVDLNRPLADYRDLATQPKSMAGAIDPNQNWPLSPATITVASYQKASAERQALASDIFVRLCVALNARVYYSPSTGLKLPQWNGTAYALTDAPASPPPGFVAKTWTASQAEYDALRWIAQLSANVVDSIDPDDVSTVFQWNSPPAGGPVTAFTPDAPGGLGDCVVFGVEKPKLLVNEAYAEVANKQADYSKNKLTSTDKFTIRFFIELLNPNNLEGTTTAGVTVDQSARSGGNAPLQFPATGTFPAFSSYRVQVYDNALAVNLEVGSTANRNYVLGQPTTPTATASLKLQASFTGMNNYVNPPQANLTQFVEPNNGAFTATDALRNGFCVIGPDLDPAITESPKTAYAPQTKTAPTATLHDGWMIVKPTPAAATTDQLEYDSPVAPVNPDQILTQVVNPANANGHAVVLQRLANPYLPPNGIAGDPGYNPALPYYNPYITVDSMGGIKVNDAIRIGLDPDGIGPKDGTRPTPAKPDESFALGRIQPYVGFQTLATTAMPTTPVFQTNPSTPPTVPTLSLLQDPQPPPPATDSRNTFFRHNSQKSAVPPPSSDATLTLPFTEPTHPDRRLVSPLELLHVSMAPSHLLTPRFWTLDPTNPQPQQPLRYRHELFTKVAPPKSGVAPNPLYRIVEVLNVKPWTYGVPHAGRTPGGININAIWDQLNKTAGDANTGESTVFQALLDPQPANTFGMPAVDKIWQQLRASRSPAWDVTPAVGATVDEVVDASTTPPTTGTDRPFKGFGVGQFDSTTGGVLNTPAGVPNNPIVTPNGNGHGVESTFLRTRADGRSLFLNEAQTDPYRQLEPLRKASNNLTTVSDNFLVVFTVGFFDIDEPSLAQTPSRVVLRREAYDQVPGDLRSQFTAVLDRTGLAVDANGGSGTGKFAQAAAATNLTRVADRTFGGKNYATYMVRFPADGSSTAAEIKVRDMPTANGSLFTLKAGSLIRFGDGPNANTFSVLSTGATVVTSPGPPAVSTTYLFYDNPTGLATVTIDSGIEVDAAGNPVVPPLPALPQRLPNAHSAGELLSLPDNEANPAGNTVFTPGNPGAVPGFDPTDLRFRGVVRYFGRLNP